MPLNVCYEGKAWKTYYFVIDDLVKEMQDFARFLDTIDGAQEEIVSIVPNTGWVRATVLMDSGFTGVKGFVIITKKRVESAQPNGLSIKYPEAFSKGLMKCLQCWKTFTKEYDKCPYCGSSSIKLVE